MTFDLTLPPGCVIQMFHLHIFHQGKREFGVGESPQAALDHALSRISILQTQASRPPPRLSLEDLAL